MSGYSDIIKDLSYTTPLNSGQTYYTPKVIAGQYTSLIISFASDQDVTLIAQFSNDGTNWDVNITKSFNAGTNYENLVIYGKWVRYSITNISVSNQTYLRVYTYANPVNSSLNAIISKVGNKYPEIQINGLPKTGFGEIKVESDTKIIDYIFTYCVTGFVKDTDFKLPYDHILGYAPNNGQLLRTNNGFLELYGGATRPNEPALVYGEPIQYSAGTSILARFTGRFRQNPVRQGGALGYQCQLLGIGNTDGSGGIDDFFGWGNIDTVSSTLNFGIHHYRGGVLINSYPQSLWNIDKCDGTNVFPALDFDAYVNIFQIQFQYLGAGAIVFSIENPDTGLFAPVHMIKYANANTSTNLSNPSVGMIMYIRTDSTGLPDSGDTDTVFCGSFCLSSEGDLTPNGDMFSVQASQTGVSPLENILTIRNKSTFYGVTNRKPIVLYIIGGAVDGTKNTEIFLRKNATLTTPSYTDVNTYLTPVEYDTTGTILGSGINLMSFNLAKVAQFHDDLRGYNIILHPGDSVSILAQSVASTEVSVSVSWKNL